MDVFFFKFNSGDVENIFADLESLFYMQIQEIPYNLKL